MPEDFDEVVISCFLNDKKGKSLSGSTVTTAYFKGKYEVNEQVQVLTLLELLAPLCVLVVLVVVLVPVTDVSVSVLDLAFLLTSALIGMKSKPIETVSV